MDYINLAKNILTAVGGQENVISATHCMTRLRFVLKDEESVDDASVEKISGVMGTARQGGQYQVIIGNGVAKCYGELKKLLPQEQEGTKKAVVKQSPVNVVLDFIAGCMTPLIPAIIAGGLLKVILVIFGPGMLGILSSGSDTYRIFYGLADASFYFMPVFLAFTASRKLGCNEYLAAIVSGMLIYPDIITMLGGTESTYLFGVIPVVHGTYSASVIPALLSALLLKYVEILVDKITPQWSKNFLKPFLIVAITAPITLCVLAPLGMIVGNGLQMAMDWIYGFAPWLAMALLCGFMPFIVMTGMHWAFTTTILLSLANPGYELFIIPGMLCNNLAQAGAAFAVAFRSRDSQMKQVAFPAAISALLAGVTEPAMYGVNLKLKKPMYAACIASGIGGFLCGIVELKGYIFVTPCLTSLVQFISPDSHMNIVYAVAIGLLSFVLAVVLTLILGKKELKSTDSDGQSDIKNPDTEEPRTISAEEDIHEVNRELAIANPVSGKMVELSQVPDTTFASGMLGEGYAVIPEEGKVYAPFDGTVEALMDTCHALGLVSAEGIGMLIHVGIDTVKLEGKYFTPHVKTGDRIRKGQLLLSFDKDKIAEEGYNTITPVLVTDAGDYRVDIDTVGTAEQGMELIHLRKSA